MNKTTWITIGLMATMAFASDVKLKNPKEIYPNKKPLISNTKKNNTIQALNGAKHLKIRNHINAKKVKIISSVNKPKHLRKRGR